MAKAIHVRLLNKLAQRDPMVAAGCNVKVGENLLVVDTCTGNDSAQCSANWQQGARAEDICTDSDLARCTASFALSGAEDTCSYCDNVRCSTYYSGQALVRDSCPRPGHTYDLDCLNPD